MWPRSQTMQPVCKVGTCLSKFCTAACVVLRSGRSAGHPGCSIRLLACKCQPQQALPRPVRALVPQNARPCALTTVCRHAAVLLPRRPVPLTADSAHIRAAAAVVRDDQRGLLPLLLCVAVFWLRCSLCGRGSSGRGRDLTTEPLTTESGSQQCTPRKCGCTTSS